MCARSEFLLMEHDVVGEVVVVKVVDLVMKDLFGSRNASVPTERHKQAMEKFRSVIVKEGWLVWNVRYRSVE
jgi:hypothetical protein